MAIAEGGMTTKQGLLTAGQAVLTAVSYLPMIRNVSPIANIVRPAALNLTGQCAGLANKVITDITQEVKTTPIETTEKVLGTAGKVAGYGATVLGLAEAGVAFAAPYLGPTALAVAEAAVPGIGWAGLGLTAASYAFAGLQMIRNRV